MMEFTRTWKSYGKWITAGISLLTFPLNAAALRGSIYITLPWGSQPGQAGRFVPPPNGDGYAAGPIGFALDAQGNIYLGDIFNHRIQRIDQKTAQAHVFRSLGRDSTLAGVEASSDKVYGIGNFGKNRTSQLFVCERDGQSTKEFNLNRLGIPSPQDIEMDNSHHLLISDNRSSQTSKMEPSWKVLEQTSDKKLFWLRSKGLYNFMLNPDKTTVLSPDGKKLAEYDGNVEVIGADSMGILYTLYEQPSTADQETNIWLAGLSPDGGEKFRIPITEKKDTLLLNPKRFWEIRMARVGPDGAVYVMGDPEDDQFRIYRYEVKE